MEAKPYTVGYYRDGRGGWPVKEFIRGLDSPDDKKAVLRAIAMLEKLGPLLDWPHTENVGKGLMVLRPRKIRVFYVHLKGDRYVLLHAYRKQTGKIPSQEMGLARRRGAEVKAQEGR